MISNQFDGFKDCNSINKQFDQSIEEKLLLILISGPLWRLFTSRKERNTFLSCEGLLFVEVCCW